MALGAQIPHTSTLYSAGFILIYVLTVLKRIPQLPWSSHVLVFVVFC